MQSGHVCQSATEERSCQPAAGDECGQGHVGGSALSASAWNTAWQAQGYQRTHNTRFYSLLKKLGNHQFPHICNN